MVADNSLIESINTSSPAISNAGQMTGKITKINVPRAFLPRVRDALSKLKSRGQRTFNPLAPTP